jgi:trk system potassium uptake protein
VVRNLEDDPQVIMGSGDVLIEDRDHLIIFLSAKEHVRKIEQLFQVGFTFF